MISELTNQRQGIIYHELGHVFGYLLSNANPKTQLGNVKRLYLGNINMVTSEQNLYHRDENELFEVFIEQIKQNTKNIERTLAWFTEVILGCTFQSIFEKNEFSDCFKTDGIGKSDLRNIISIRKLSAFKWCLDDIYQMQQKMNNLLIKFEVIKKIKPIVENLKIELGNAKSEILEIKGDRLVRLSSEISKSIPLNMYDEYFEIIEKIKIRIEKNSC